MTGNLLFYFTYPLLWLLGWLPLQLLYILSDLIYPLLYYVVRYRVKVVRSNLANAFPDKSEQERKQLEKRFYHHLCDYGMETLWLIHSSEKAMKRHICFDNIELLETLRLEGKNVIALFGHYCNWEWVCSIPLHMSGNMQVGTLYKPLSNKKFDQFFFKLRSRFGIQCIPKNNVMRNVLQMIRNKQSYALAFIADQTPSGQNIHYWTSFLNQETPFLTGWESIARKTLDAVVFLDMRKERRGYYHCKVELLCREPKTMDEYALTELYARRMEENILIDPAFWLWSHKRWKYKPN